MQINSNCASPVQIVDPSRIPRPSEFTSKYKESVDLIICLHILYKC